ncbi:MAG TPA: hypothetical protein VME42_08565 [Steroidobacteraceae bacterium]|nr:hypothetical protein [Steroidobacteraceae bacterium]
MYFFHGAPHLTGTIVCYDAGVAKNRHQDFSQGRERRNYRLLIDARAVPEDGATAVRSRDRAPRSLAIP